MIKTMYFDTGVKPWSGSPLYGNQVWRNGTKQIPFDVEDVPDNAVLMWIAPVPDMKEAEYPNVIVRKIFNTSIVNEYAYFKVWE